MECASRTKPTEDATPGGPPPRLVIRLDAGEAEAVPDRRGLSVELQEPESEPAAIERAFRELAVERLGPAGEARALVAPSRSVEAEEDVQVGGELVAIVREAKAQLMLARELPLAPPNLRAEVCASLGQHLVPGRAIHAQDRTGTPPKRPSSDQAAPGRVPREQLAEKNVPALPAERLSQRTRGRGAVRRRADRPQLVGRAVADEADDRDWPLRCGIH